MVRPRVTVWIGHGETDASQDLWWSRAIFPELSARELTSVGVLVGGLLVDTEVSIGGRVVRAFPQRELTTPTWMRTIWG